MSSSEDEEVVFSVEDDSTSQESDEDYQADQAIDDSINSPINLDQEPVASPRYRKDHKKPGEGFGSAQSRNLAHTQQKRPAVLRPNGSTRKPKYKKKMVLPTKHPIRHRHHIMAGGPSSPRLGRYVQLYSKNGYNLKITMNGSVEGTEEVRSDLAILELDPVALRLYSIRGVKAKRFLCMDAKGRLIGMRRRSEKCLFHASHRPNGSLTFSTLRTSIKGAPVRWFVAINKVGVVKRGRKESHKGTNFLPRIAHRHQAKIG